MKKTKDDYLKAIKIRNAIFDISEFIEKSPQEIISKLSFLDEKTFNKIKKVIDLANEFSDMDLKQRAEVLGFYQNFK
jgi:hypothetical protein